MSQATEHKMYWDERTRSWTAKWKDPTRGWRMKRIPCEITHEDEATLWFDAWLQAEIAKGPPPPPVPVCLTIDQMMQRWVEYLKTTYTDPARWKDADACRRNWVVPYKLGSVQAQDLKLSDCVDWIEEIERTDAARTTVRNVIQQVRTFLSDARGKGWREKENFFLDPYVKGRLRRAYGTAPKSPNVHLSLADVKKMVAFGGDAVPFRRHVRNLFSVLTGLRSSEVAGLRVGHLDLDAAVPNVEVERQFVVRRSSSSAPFFKPPKRNSYRRVPLHPLLVDLLRTWLNTGWQAWTGREPTVNDPLFPSQAGDWTNDFRPGELRLDLSVYGASSVFEGTEPIDVQALRRTFLTLLTDAGVPEGDVKSLAGHSAGNVTRAHYIGANLVRFQRGVLSIPLNDASEEAAA